MRARASGWLAILLSGALGLTACGTGGGSSASKPSGQAPSASAPQATGVSPSTTAPAPTTPPPPQTVRVAETVAISYAPVYLADAHGYFREQGLELEWENFAGGADAVPALARGDFDVNLGSISAGTYNAAERGLDIKIVAPMGILPLTDSPLPLIVRRDLADSGAVNGPGDLRGKRVAVNTRAAIVEYVLTKALERDGLALGDVEEVVLGFPDHAQAFATGSIDASVTAEPFATRAFSQSVAVKLLAEIAPLRMTTVAMYSGKFIRERNDAAKRWMVAAMRGARELQGPELGVSYPDRFFAGDNLAVFEQRTGANAQVIRNQVPYTWDPNLEIQLDFILDQELVHMRNGVLQLAQPIPPERLVDDSFVRYARDTLGPPR